MSHTLAHESMEIVAGSLFETRKIKTMIMNTPIKCQRCGKECQGGIGNPEARLLKRSTKGYCADCALTVFLKKETPFEYSIQNNGIEILRDKNVRLQIAKLLIVGKSDASISEIDMERVITNWNLPDKG